MSLLKQEIVDKLNTFTATYTTVYNVSSKNEINNLEQNTEVFLTTLGLSKAEVKAKNTFIAQPNGSQKAPDFYVYDNNEELLKIECKSGSTINFNSGYLCSDIFYIFLFRDGTLKHGFASDILQENACALYTKIRTLTENEYLNIPKKLKEQLSAEEYADMLKYKFTPYSRYMLKGISKKNKVFKTEKDT